MEVKLYNRDLASPVLEEVLTDRISRLRFSTRLPGGFFLCTFEMEVSVAEAWRWLNERTFYRLVITDVSKTLWEGRLEDVEWSSQGRIGLTFYGYYANLSDVPYATAFNNVASVIIKAVLTASCLQISSDQSHIAATDIAITSAGDESYLDIYPNELVEKLLAFSDTTFGKWDFAIWESRVPWLSKRNPTAVNWKASLLDFNQFQLAKKAQNLWNAAYAVYEAAGAIARTADADNASSQTKYGLKRKYVVPNVGEVAVAAANGARDGWLQKHAELYPEFTQSPILGDKVQDSNGRPYPSCWLRAGEVIRIRDLIPASGLLDSVTLDALTTFFVAGTEYDAEKRENNLLFDTQNNSLTALLARKLK